MLPSTYMLTATCCPATSCSFRIHVDCISATLITIHLCHGQLVSLFIQQQTDNKLATILLPIYKQHVEGNRTHVADNMLPWCKRGFRPFHSRVKSRHATDKRTDGQTDRQTDRHRCLFCNAPPYGGGDIRRKQNVR